jgi:hypothetical protein
MKFPFALFALFLSSTCLNAQEMPAVKVDSSVEKTAKSVLKDIQSSTESDLKTGAIMEIKSAILKENIPVSKEDVAKKAQSMGENAANKTLDKAAAVMMKLPFLQKSWTSGSTNFSFVNSASLSGINIALSPAFGYKLTPKLSVGPRFEIRYGYMKGVVNYSTVTSNVSSVSTFSTFTYSAAAFSRLKAFGNFFLHGEIGYQSLETPMFKAGFLDYDATAKKVMTARDNRPTTYIGIGYNNNGTDMLFLYNLVPQDKNNLFALPFDYRIGFTNNF